MVRQHQRLNGHGFEQTLGNGEGPKSLACYSPWRCQESDKTATEQQIEVQLIYNVVLVSDVQQSDPVIHIYIYIFFFLRMDSNEAALKSTDPPKLLFIDLK